METRKTLIQVRREDITFSLASQEVAICGGGEGVGRVGVHTQLTAGLAERVCAYLIQAPLPEWWMEQEKTTRIRNQLLQDLSNTRVNRSPG